MSSHGTPLQDAIRLARGRRNRLAAAVRAAQLELDRTPASRSPDRRARHEVEALEQALAVLIAPAPEPKLHGVDAELDVAMRVPLDVALELAK